MNMPLPGLCAALLCLSLAAPALQAQPAEASIEGPVTAERLPAADADTIAEAIATDTADNDNGDGTGNEEDHSPEATLYRIDLLVFANSDPAAEASERWLPPKRLPLPDALRLLDPPREDGTMQAHARLPALADDFAAAADRMRRSRYYRVLLADSWLQPLPPGSPTPAIVLRGGSAHGLHHELEGSLELRRDRFLHAHARLWLSRFSTDFDPDSGDWPPLPALPQAAAPDPAEPGDAGTDTATEDPADAPWPEPAATEEHGSADSELLFAPRPDRIVLMDQRRRLRGGEVHYLDHPLFGLILRITPQATATLPSQ